MTESEFQEFLITVGYRYNTKSKSAFNTFEGFHTIIYFNDKENRYTLTLGAATGDLGKLLEKIGRFASDNKSYIAKSSYKDRRIRMNIRMTIDSDIDKENLKEVAKFIKELCKSEIITPVCRVCATNRKTGLYVIGRELVPVCDSCIAKKRKQYEHRRDMFIKKKQNMPAGIFGAVFGAAMGASLYILLYQINSLYGIFAGFIAAFCFAGFVITGKRATKLSAVICEIISVMIFVAAEYMAQVANMAVLIEQHGGGIAVSEAISATNSSIEDTSYLNILLIEMIVGILVMMIIGIIYFLKRKYTRPLKISKNIL